MDPVSKIVYGRIWRGLANEICDKLINDEENTPTTYKPSWLLDTSASGHYGDNNTKVWNKKKIQPRLGINVGCADNRILSQTREGELPFDNVSEGTEDVQLFYDMH